MNKHFLDRLMIFLHLFLAYVKKVITLQWILRFITNKLITFNN